MVNLIRGIILFAIMLISPILLSFTKEEIAQFYQKAKTIETQMIQEKQASYLLKPLVSKVRFFKDKERIIWESIEPIKFHLEMDLLGNLKSSNQAQEIFKNPIIRKKIQKIAKMLQSIFSADFVEFEKDFTVKFSQNILLAQPRHKETPLNYDITMEFDKNKYLKSVLMKNADETLKFEVIDFKIK